MELSSNNGRRKGRKRGRGEGWGNNPKQVLFRLSQSVEALEVILASGNSKAEGRKGKGTGRHVTMRQVSQTGRHHISLCHSPPRTHPRSPEMLHFCEARLCSRRMTAADTWQQALRQPIFAP